MTDPNGPTVRRRRLGSELRRLRGKLRLEDVGNELGCSASKVSRIENGQGLAKKIEIEAMLRMFGVTDEHAREQILDIWRKAGESGWWEQAEYEAVLPSGLGVYVGLEYDARMLQTWELGYVPGLLQTEAYARAVLLDSWPGQIDEIERLAAVRTQRQQRLTAADDPLELWAVMDESVILRPVGGREVMREQILHLLKAAQMPNVNLQVYPLAKGVHPGLRGAFTILEFGSSDPRVVYVDNPSGNTFVERDRQVRRFTQKYDSLRAAALDPQESAALLRSAVKEY
ncbi:helix-turn-helix domain-containing protein [Streptomyces sp. NPDC092296]|uniref:helix-turn-helix domain-containing protein n=1 Tax=Streptomyces sp. NPDC092296 TaxID=3366012 RepID=UPI003802B43F